MSNILMCSSPTLGHVAPLLAVARHLAANGHSVRFLTGERYESLVTATGARFLALPSEADIDLDDPNATFPQRTGLTGLTAIKFDIINLFVRPAPAQMRALDAAILAEPTDAVVSEELFIGASDLPSRPRRSRPTIVALGIVPLALEDPDVAPPGFGLAPLSGPLGRARNAVLRWVASEFIFRSIIREGTQLMREAGANVEAGFEWMKNADALIQFTVPEFEYPRSTLPDNVHFVGPVSRTVASDAPLPEWWAELDNGRPVVHVTQGTVANKDFGELITPAIAGLAEQDVNVVVSTGKRPLSDLPHPLPPNVFAAEFLPYDRLLPRTDVLVTNGGYGGVHYALEHGVPLVVAGMTEDKMEVSARVAWSGAGINLRTNKPKPHQIRNAVRRALSDESYRRASRRLGAAIEKSPGLDEVERIILTEIATTLSDR